MPQLHSDSSSIYYLFLKVRRRLVEVTASFWTDYEVYSALNEGQKKIAEVTKCLQKEITVTTVSGTQTYDLRDEGYTDVIDISKEGAYFYVNGSSYQPLTYKNKKQLDKEFPGWQGVSASVPQYFYFEFFIFCFCYYP